MAKCSQCGKKGLFLKLNSSGICENCQSENGSRNRLEAIRQQIDSCEQQLKHTDQLLEAAKQAAKSEAQRQLESECEALRNACDKLRAENLEAVSRRDALVLEGTEAQKNLDALQRRTEKLKPIAGSIKSAYKKWVETDLDSEAYAQIECLGIDQLLPQPDLNCLTIKELRSRYNALRKQIVELCAAYESRYTTKANATIYKLMVLALESGMENVLYKLQFGKLEVGINAVRDLTSKYYQIASEGNQSIAPTLKKFVGQIESLYLDVVATEYEYYVQRERAKEEQRAIKEQMRQETEERRQLEAQRKQVENEEKKYRQEMERIRQQMVSGAANIAELEKLRLRLSELECQLDSVESKKAEIIRLQNGKAGTVYIISNVGSFGSNVFKVGMTRRLEPQDRVDELGNASVPFPFDVHSFIFSQDAVFLENQLHKELNERRVNKINLRKEFFSVSVEELQAMVERIDPTAPFKETALAEQYRQSLSMDKVPEFGTEVEQDDEGMAL